MNMKKIRIVWCQKVDEYCMREDDDPTGDLLTSFIIMNLDSSFKMEYMANPQEMIRFWDKNQRLFILSDELLRITLIDDSQSENYTEYGYSLEGIPLSEEDFDKCCIQLYQWNPQFLSQFLIDRLIEKGKIHRK